MSERARLAAERGRRRSEAVQATILAHSPDAVLMVSDDGEVELANEAAVQMFGSPDLCAAHGLSGLLPELTLEALRTSLGSPLRTPGCRSGGQSFPCELVGATVPFDEGARLVLFVRDISRQRRLEQQLARSRQLEAAGRLASGVAHDLNSLLSVVAMITYQLPGASTDELGDLGEDLGNAVDLGTALTTRLLALARRGKDAGEVRSVDVNEVLRAVERLVRRSVSTTVDVGFDLGVGVGTVALGFGQLEQIVLNLAINANRAMPEGGRLRVQTRAEMDAGRAAWVMLEVEDTGVGMDAELQRRVFEPFFTTRQDAGGTGLGLSIVKELVEGAGGELSLESAAGQGSCFRIRLPRRGDVPTDELVFNKRDSGIGRGRQVLLVDDDELHRRAMKRLLGSWGFAVIEAAGAGDALLIGERLGAEIDLVIADVDMPYMDGFELSTRLREDHSGMPVLLVSGSVTSNRQTLDKPVDPQTLLNALGRLLDNKESH